MNKVTKHMTVEKVEEDGDRILLYGADKRYHVIASPDSKVRVGDCIAYEPYGVNFGWLIERELEG